MQYAIITIVFVMFLIGKSIYNEKENHRKLLIKLQKAWGEVPDEEYTSEKFNALKKYYTSIKEDDKDVDDITFNDLDMKQIYMLINNTGCAIGEEYLYALIRKPLYNEKELLERNRLIHYFTKNEEERLKIQTILNTMGKLKNVSIFEYINRTDNIKDVGSILHYFMSIGLLISIILCFIKPGIGGILTILFLANNIINYYKTKAKIESYFTVFSYILRMLDAIKELRKFNFSELNEYTKQFERAESAFKRFKKGSYLVVGGRAMGGDLGDMILDYIRMLFHVDIIKFDTMLGILRKNRGILNELYNTIGILDSMIAVASFRELMIYYTEPVLVLGTKPFIKVEEIYHPLLEEPVMNSLETDNSVLITGSNASGKSTFIKTMAINGILSQTIYTSLSRSYEANYFRIFSSMALRDDIFSNESYYIVEIKSLKRILDKITGEIPILCFVDEVLRGTNTLERIAASTQILYSLTKGNALCFAATHDLELTHILEKHYFNYHFREYVKENQILFDYKLHDGRAISKNAIKLLGIMGYSENIIQNATSCANDFLEKGKWSMLE